MLPFILHVTLREFHNFKEFFVEIADKNYLPQIKLNVAKLDPEETVDDHRFSRRIVASTMKIIWCCDCDLRVAGEKLRVTIPSFNVECQNIAYTGDLPKGESASMQMKIIQNLQNAYIMSFVTVIEE